MQIANPSHKALFAKQDVLMKYLVQPRVLSLNMEFNAFSQYVYTHATGELLSLPGLCNWKADDTHSSSRLGQNDVFSTSPLIPQQSQQQQFQPAQANVATQMMYSAGPYTTSAAPAATTGQVQSTALMHRRSFQAPQPYSTNTWTTVGGNIAKYPSQHQTGAVENAQRPVSMTALSMRNLGMQSAHPQANFIPSPMGLDQSMYIAFL
jgi:hypothetical protein